MEKNENERKLEVSLRNFTQSSVTSTTSKFDENEADDDDLIGPPVPSQFRSNSVASPSCSVSSVASHVAVLDVDESDDDGLIGPPIPPRFTQQPQNIIAKDCETKNENNKNDTTFAPGFQACSQ